MSGSLLICALLAGSAEPVPPADAPPPRIAKPVLSLVLVEEVTGPSGGVDRRRVVRVGVSRNGRLFAPETIWESGEQFLGSAGGHRVVNDRYLVTRFGAVIDLTDKKVLNNVESGELRAIDGGKVYYQVTTARREECVFSFDLETHKARKEANIGEGKFALRGQLSPDGLAAIERGATGGELVLNQVGAKPKSLGKGFEVNMGPAASVAGSTPVLWLNPGTILTQRGNGKIVTVDAAGTITDLLTIKDAPKDLVSSPYFFRDGSDRVVYVCGRAAYAIDVGKKEWAKSEWRDLGHGFEASWEQHNKLGHKLRHNGKEIGSVNCWPHAARTAPGLLALTANYRQDAGGPPECVAVYSVARGEWQTLSLWPNSLVGWVKEEPTKPKEKP